MIGTQVGHYRITSRIGAGGMGEVFRATDTRLGREVAIKFLPEAIAETPAALERFEREARAASALSHPNIATLHDVGEHAGRRFLVMELLEGATLKDRIAGGPLPVDEALAIARQLSDALAAAHAKAIVHRDVKPSNVIVLADGHVKLLDFGLAKRAPARPARDTRAATVTSNDVTRIGEAVGTVAYMSPEQARGEDVDARTDVFSLGCVLYEMLTGIRPFVGSTAATVFDAILNRDPVRPRDIDPTLPRAVEAVVLRALAKDRARRLRAGAERGEARRAAAVPGPRTSRRAVLATAGAGLALLAGGVWTWRGRRDPWGGGPVGASGTLSTGEPPSSVPEANEYFEKALLFLRVQLDLPRAQRMLERAVASDPSFGPARVLYGLTFLIAINEGISNDGGLVYRAERDARDVLAAQPELASARATLGASLMYLNRKEQARRELEAALALDPRCHPASAWLTLDAYLRGIYTDAESRARAMLETLPLFFVIRVLLANVLFETGRIDEARHELDKVFEQDSGNVAARCAAARLRLAGGDVAGARSGLEAGSAATDPNFRLRLTWALLLASEGLAEKARAALDDEVAKFAGVALFGATHAAEVLALAGRPRDALDWLDRAVRGGDERAAWFRRDPFLAPLRAEPRFTQIVESLDAGRER